MHKKYNLIINEAMHYPKFLDNVKMETAYNVRKCLSDMLKQRKYTVKDAVINLKHYKEYFNSFILTINLTENEDINNRKNYGAESFSDGKLINGKLSGAKINVIAPVNSQWKTNDSYLIYVICHEVTHLYDDYMDLKNGGTGIFRKPENIYNMDFMRNAVKSQNNLVKSLRWLVYLSIKTESNAFAQELMQELKMLQATHYNIKEKYKETVSYNNLKKTEIEFFNTLENTDYIELLYANDEIVRNYPKTTIPKMNINQFDAFAYYNMLKDIMVLSNFIMMN